MAIESRTAPQVGPPERPVIENEIPAYRAISGAAVTSLVLGASAVFCFTSLWFLLVVLAAVLFGVRALGSIRRLPEILTGAKIAQAGIGLGLLFGLGAVGLAGAQYLSLRSEASAFAEQYVDVLRTKPLETAVWYTQAADFRKDKTPEQVTSDMQQAKGGPSGESLYDSETREVRQIHKRLRAAGQAVRFAQLENQLADGLTHYANALIELDGPSTPEFPDAEQFALLQLIKVPGGGRGDWRIRKVLYPYKPASAGLEKEHKDDDGHGHGH